MAGEPCLEAQLVIVLVLLYYIEKIDLHQQKTSHVKPMKGTLNGVEGGGVDMRNVVVVEMRGKETLSAASTSERLIFDSV